MTVSALPPAPRGRPVAAHDALAAWLGTDLADLRRDLVVSTLIWGGAEPLHRVEDDFWYTLSGARLVDYNAAGTWSDDPERLIAAREVLDEARLPGNILVAGPALGSVRVLSEAGWTCATSTRFMARPLAPGPSEDPDIERLAPERLGGLRRLVEDTFALSPMAGRLSVPEFLALPRVSPDAPAFDAWGLVCQGELVSGLLTAVVGESVCLWSMATTPVRHRQGLGFRLLSTVLNRLHDEGARRAVLIATRPGERLYRRIGYLPFDYWQCWTKARYLPLH